MCKLDFFFSQKPYFGKKMKIKEKNQSQLCIFKEKLQYRIKLIKQINFRLKLIHHANA